MKRISIISKVTIMFTMLVLLFGVNSFAATPKQPRRIQYTALSGDVDRDGKVTSADAMTVFRFSAQLESLSFEQQYIADIDKDNKITAADARLILKMSTKQIKQTKVGFNFMPGNVNHNNVVDSDDATRVLKHSARLLNLTLAEQVAADVNCDGKITAADARLILNRSANNISAFPIEGDITGNGKLGSKDANLVLRYSARLENFTKAQKFIADVNRDGQVTAADARIILRRSQGLE